jgi:catechol 2,3-dioxygenase
MIAYADESKDTFLGMYSMNNEFTADTVQYPCIYPAGHHLPLIRQVALKSADLQRAVAFYENDLELVTMADEGRYVLMGTDGDHPPLLKIVEDRNARRRAPGMAGLFHLALRYPRREMLARLVRNLLNRGQHLYGYVDHGVSEAVYLSDADGNGIELAWDKPTEAWPFRNGRLAMTTERLDLANLLSSETVPGEGTHPVIIGHLHLQVQNLTRAARFFNEKLGLHVTQDTYPGALFMARGNYHHHIAVNVWAGENVPLPDDTTTGLIGYTVGLSERNNPKNTIRDPNGAHVNFLQTEEASRAEGIQS